MTAHSSSFHAIEWRGQSLHLLDQRVLPHTHTVHEYTTANDVADAIRDMVVRGAPAIGIT
ncbi:MAG: S-methyl-5-thioribose-1-phosphate isomerase, partial [Pseudomonadota bacterium]|nr:S-methyl-5-thioribose-1-phosphate isomerase [Pseudomonadota bacterium]